MRSPKVRTPQQRRVAIAERLVPNRDLHRDNKQETSLSGWPGKPDHLPIALGLPGLGWLSDFLLLIRS